MCIKDTGFLLEPLLSQIVGGSCRPVQSIFFDCIFILRAMLHNETVYPDPFEFDPDRFMKDGQLNPAVRDPDAAFGFGRR